MKIFIRLYNFGEADRIRTGANRVTAWGAYHYTTVSIVFFLVSAVGIEPTFTWVRARSNANFCYTPFDLAPETGFEPVIDGNSHP